MAQLSTVLVDTDIFGSLYVRPDRAGQRGHPVAAWRSALEGVRVVISFQTRAEVLAGVLIDSWGKRRVADVRELLDAMPTVGVDSDVIDAYARLRADCRRAGHPLHARPHNADRWHAACAIAKGLPLFARDGIYAGAPGLTLFDRASTQPPITGFQT